MPGEEVVGFEQMGVEPEGGFKGRLGFLVARQGRQSHPVGGLRLSGVGIEFHSLAAARFGLPAVFLLAASI